MDFDECYTMNEEARYVEYPCWGCGKQYDERDLEEVDGYLFCKACKEEEA